MSATREVYWNVSRIWLMYVLLIAMVIVFIVATGSRMLGSHNRGPNLSLPASMKFLFTVPSRARFAPCGDLFEVLPALTAAQKNNSERKLQ